jgi:hypothetical protein
MTGNSTVGALGSAAIGGGAVIAGVGSAEILGRGAGPGLLPVTGGNPVFSALTIAAISIALLALGVRLLKIYSYSK